MSFVSVSQIAFEKISISQAIEKANSQNDLVFVEFYSTQCPPCKFMELNVFSDAKLGTIVNEDFVCVQSNAGSFEGKIEKFENSISMYPTVLVLNKNGKEILRVEGKRQLDEFTKMMEDILVNKSELLDLPKDSEIKPNENIMDGSARLTSKVKVFVKPEEGNA